MMANEAINDLENEIMLEANNAPSATFKPPSL